MQLRDPTRESWGNVVDSILEGRASFSPGASTALSSPAAASAAINAGLQNAPMPPSRPAENTPTNPTGAVPAASSSSSGTPSSPRSASAGAAGLDPVDRALSVGALMGEETNIVGMGLVAASALNRAERPSDFASKSSRLGDVFSAPHRGTDMVRAIQGQTTLPNTKVDRQYSTTLNIRETRDAFQAFKAGALHDLGIQKGLGQWNERYNKATIALDVAVKARDMGIDLGFGVTNYGAGKAAAKKAGAGPNVAEFGNHRLGPFERNVTPPTEPEIGARFAAAAALTGVEIPEQFQSEVAISTTPDMVMAAAGVMQRQAQDYLSEKLGYDVMPGFDYSEAVPKTGLGAIDVPDFTDQMVTGPHQSRAFAEHYGVVPSEQVDVPIDPAAVDLSDVPGLIDGPTRPTGQATPAPAGAFSRDMLGPAQSFTPNMRPEDIQPAAPAQPDFTGVRQGMTEQQALSRLGDVRFSDNVEVRPNAPGFGEDVDAAIGFQNRATEFNQLGSVDIYDKIANEMSLQLGPPIDVNGIVSPMSDVDPRRDNLGTWTDIRDAVQDIDYERHDPSPLTREVDNLIGFGDPREQFGLQFGMTPAAPEYDHSAITAGLLHSVEVEEAPAPAATLPAGIIDGPPLPTGQPTDAPLGAFSTDPLGTGQGVTHPNAASLFGGQPLGPAQSFSPDLAQHAGFNAQPAASPHPDAAALFGSQPLGPAQGFGEDFARPEGFNAPPVAAAAPEVQPATAGASPSGFRTGTGEDPYSQPDHMGPHLSEYDWTGGDAIRTAQEKLDATARAANLNDQLVDRVQSSPFEATAAGFKQDQVSPSLNAFGSSSLLGTVTPEITGAPPATSVVASAVPEEAPAPAPAEKPTESAPIVGGMNSYAQATENFAPSLTGIQTKDVPAISSVGAFGISPNWGKATVAPAPTPVAAAIATPTPAPRPTAPATPKPAAIAPTPKVEVKALDRESLANNVKTGTAAYSGFQNAQEAMSAIGAGTAAAPKGVSEYDMRTAFSDSVYAGASYNAVMDAVAKQGGFPERKDIDTGLYADMGLNPETARATVNGAIKGGLTGGIPGAVAGAIMGGTGWGAKVDSYLSGVMSGVFGSGSNGGGLQVSDGRGGYRSADALDAMNNPDIADALGYGGRGGSSGGGMTGAMGGYGSADGSPSSNAPGIW